MRNLKSQPKNTIIKLYRETEEVIKRKCYECQCGQKKLDCQLTSCPLYPLRPWVNKQSRENDQFPEAK